MATPLIRPCDGCRKCCYTHAVATPEGKVTEAFAWCKLCSDHGCSVHATDLQPYLCQQWHCAWQEGLGSEEERPDKTNIVPEWRFTRQGRTLVLIEAMAGALESEYGKALASEYARRRIPQLHVFHNGRKRLIFERDIIVDASLMRQAQKENVEIVFVDT